MQSPAAQTIMTHRVEDTEAIGEALGARLGPGDVICLEGDLGAGKTALVRGLGRGWGALERVTSPTFTLVHEHRRAQDDHVLYHVDCYRLDGRADAGSLGLEDILDGDDCVVLEWPERVAEILPGERLWIAFTILGYTQRALHVTASGPRYAELLAVLRDGTRP